MDSSLESTVNQSGLRLNGNCGYKVEGNRITVFVDNIQSDRPFDNLSGTLRIEVQAFPSDGHSSNSLSLASTTVGEIKGQHLLTDCSYDLIFQEPPEGSWIIGIALSEWSGTEYSFCDAVYFNVPYLVELPPISPSAISNEAIELNSTDLKPVPTTKQKPEKIYQTITDKDLKQINRVKLDRLTKIKGMPVKVAERVMTQRPFTSLKAILSVKGMGPKLLDKILEDLNK